MTTRTAFAFVILLGLTAGARAQTGVANPVAPGPVSGPLPAGTAPLAPQPVPGLIVEGSGAALFCSPTEAAPARRAYCWGSVDYMMGWVSGARLGSLVTTSPPGTPRLEAGVLGLPNTQVLYGNSPTNAGLRSGIRANLGLWLDDTQTFSLEGGFFVLESQSEGFRTTPGRPEIVAIPFFDAATGAAFSALVNYTNLVSGTVSVSARSGALNGWNLELGERFCVAPYAVLTPLIGYRALHYKEELNIVQQTQYTFVPGADVEEPLVNGTQVTARDRFATRNDLNGLSVGLKAEVGMDNWSVELLTRVTAGFVTRDIDVSGGTVISVPGEPPASYVGGLLALPSNIGNNSSHSWVPVPEIGLTFKYQLTEMIGLRLGYAFLYWPQVARPDEQIDRVIDPNLIPPALAEPTSASRPAVLLGKSDLWSQSITLGAEIRY